MQFAQAALPVTVGCSSAALVSAIATANAGGASDLLLSPGCTYSLTAVNNTTDTANGLPQVTGPLSLHGNGAVITRSATAVPFRILEVGATGNVALNALTISNGSVDTRSTGGAGIHNALGGRLTLTGTQIINNVITGFDGHGAGLLNDGYADVTGSVIGGNSIPGVDGAGGGIYNDGGGAANAQVKSTVIGNNTVGLAGGPSGASPYGEGGGIANFATMAVTGGTVTGNSVIANGGSGNSGAEGGGIVDGTVTAGTSFTLTSSLVTGNSATAIGASGRALGGGIDAQGKLMSLSNTTVSNNSISLAQLPGNPPWPPAVEGAGIQNGYGNALWLQNGSHVLNNTASSGIVGVTVSGGGIENESGTVDLMTASTVAGNSVSAPSGTAVGGGINNDSGPGTVNLMASAVVANTPDNCAPAGTTAGC